MKHTYLIVLALILTILLAACGRTGSIPSDSSSESSSSATSETTESLSESSSESSGESTTDTDGTSTSAGTESANSNSSSSTSGGGKTNSSSSGNTSKPKDQPASSTAPPPTQSSEVVLPKDALPSDADAIANKIIEYINQYRVAQGKGTAKKLPGLTQVAKYRSNQLVSNYAHDLNATNEATRAFQYGEHVVYGDLDYYDHGAREAIGKSGGNNSIDDVANTMATGFKNSPSHWNYVGGASYKYIAVGATYGNGQWYICILMTDTNIYG